jgi:hypothetical protein
MGLACHAAVTREQSFALRMTVRSRTSNATVSAIRGDPDPPFWISPARILRALALRSDISTTLYRSYDLSTISLPGAREPAAQGREWEIARYSGFGGAAIPCPIGELGRVEFY